MSFFHVKITIFSFTALPYKKTGRLRVRLSNSSKAKLVGFFRVNGDLLALCIEAFKLHLTVNKGEQGKVPAHTDIVAFVEVRAALTNDDVASLDDFACVLLNTKVLGVTVAAVTY